MPYLEPIQNDYERDRRMALAQQLREPGVKPSNKAAVIAQLLSNILAGRQEDSARGEFDEKQAQYDAALQGLGGAQTPEAFQQAIASDPYLARQMAPVMAEQRFKQMFKEPDATSQIVPGPQVGLPEGYFAEVTTKGGKQTGIKPIAPQETKRDKPAWYNDDGTINQSMFDAEIKLRQAGANAIPREPLTDPRLKDAPTGTTWVDPSDPRKGVQPIPGAPDKAGTNYSPKEKQIARDKLQMLRVAHTQLQDLKTARDKLLGEKGADGKRAGAVSAGPLGLGLIPTEEGRQFDAAVNRMRSTITSLTRVPGVGAMSDYETRLDQSKFPSRNDYESVMDDQIAGLEQFINQLESGYSEIGGGQSNTAPPAAPGGFKVIRKRPQ